MSDEGQIKGTNAVFPPSCWTAILSLKPDGDTTSQRRAFETLCETYWFPLYAFVRHRGRSSHDAEDAVQSFFSNICDLDYLSKATQDKGKLRTFILTGFTRHLKDLKVHASAQKRGAGLVPLSLDTDQAEEWISLDAAAPDLDASLNFERNWAKNLMRSVEERLNTQAAKKPETEKRFTILKLFLNPHTCRDFTSRQAAEQLAMSPAATEKAIQRLRHQFRLEVREQVAATLENPTEESILEEITQLQRALLDQ